MGRIETQILILPAARQADAVDERGVHSEPTIVMLELASNDEPSCVVRIGALSSNAVARLAVTGSRV